MLRSTFYGILIFLSGCGDFVTETDTNACNNAIDQRDYDTALSACTSRKNKATDITEYYNFIYQYKNDCLAASIEYNKDYYDDRDIKPEESIFFK